MTEEMWERKSIEGILSSIFLILILIIVLIQIFLRLFPLFNVVWTEELSRWAWVWMVCIGWGELERGDHHLKMDLLKNKMSVRSRLIMNIILDIVYVVVVINLIQIGVKQVLNNLGSMSVTLPFNFHVLYLSLPLGLLFVIVRIFLRIAKNVLIVHEKTVRTGE